MHQRTEKLVEDIMKLLTEHRVNNYVIALADPDDNQDSITSNGSPYWLLGVGMELIERHRLMNRIKFDNHDDEETEV